ncbi:hypothetical protein AB0H49_30890 [Nocardia sp. NPDC050713]|uniref:hypothetical protein n=1 Tax=Nocardia sp. NPDC050713 TaxID=3154511 RepID=UPI0033CD0766
MTTLQIYRGLGGAFGDGEHAAALAAAVGLARDFGPARGAVGAQLAGQFVAQFAAGLDEQCPVDRLV